MLEAIIIVLVAGIDQISKYLSELYLTPVGTTYPLWKSVFHLTSVHNRGAAFGMMQGGKWIFIVLTVVVVVVAIVFLVRWHQKLHPMMRISIALIISGALGNLIDRVALDYVRDMFDFCLIQFPVFNVADCAVCIGVALLLIDILFSKKGRKLLKDVFGEAEVKHKTKR